MKRRLFTLLAVLSLLLCVAMVLLWVRSHWVEDYAVKGQAGSDCVVVFSGHGSIWIAMAGDWPGQGQWLLNSEPVGAFSAFSPAIGVSRSSGPLSVRERHVM